MSKEVLYVIVGLVVVGIGYFYLNPNLKRQREISDFRKRFENSTGMKLPPIDLKKAAQELENLHTARGQEMPTTQLTESASEIIAKYEDKSVMLISADESIKITVLRVKGEQALAVWAKLRTAVDEIKSWPVIIEKQKAPNSKNIVDELISKAFLIDTEQWLNQKKKNSENDLTSFDKPSSKKSNPFNEFSAHIDIMKNKFKPEVLIALVPTIHPWEVPAYFGFGGGNENPQPEEHVAFLKHWKDLYGAEIVSLSSWDTMELYVNHPPIDSKECLALAKTHFLYCSDRVSQGAETLQNLAGQLCNGKAWYFWWD